MNVTPMKSIKSSLPPSAPPARIQWHKQSNTLELGYTESGKDDSLRSFELNAEFLRVHSPSAEVRGHGQQGGELPYGKADVKISAVRPSGNYALHILFDDEHDSGIYTWAYLAQLCLDKNQLWSRYLEQLRKENKSRFIDEQVVKFV